MAKLVSVNVGMPKSVPWKGRTVYTGAWKYPVDGPRMLRRLNLDGDGQGDTAGHGGEIRAVLVYQLASYRYWARELHREDLAPGMFGENLTVDGLPDDEVCIGDRYRIGDAIVEVTQPRVTCYRAGMRIAEPRLAALLVAHHRPGFYCRVLTEGEVAAGQDIVKISEGPQRISVAEMDALLYLPGHPRENLERALGIPALSPGWRTSLQSLLEQAGRDGTAAGNSGLTGTAMTPPSWAGFRSMRISAIHTESRDVRSLTLVDTNGAVSPQWVAGQSIALRVPAGAEAVAVVRNYSLCNSPGAGAYRIGVKRESPGTVSTYIHDKIGVGDVVEVAAPRGTFCLVDTTNPVLLVSAGIGVTPLLSMLHHLVASRSNRPVWWLYAARDGEAHPFADEVRTLLGQLANARSHVVYSRPSATDRTGIDYDQVGHLDYDTLVSLAPPRDADAYLCGPQSFMDQFGETLRACGLDPANIHHETFGALSAITPGIAAVASEPPHLPAGMPGSGPMVEFARSAIAAPWSADYASLLEFAEACDVPTRWSCRTGVCHTCETAVLAGQVDYDLEPLDPPATGTVLLCVATPTQPLVLDL